MKSSSPIRALFAGMNSWHLNHTAREFEKEGALVAYWMGNKRPPGVPRDKYKRIWPYHLIHKPFIHLPFLTNYPPIRFLLDDIEERIRWNILPLYEAWMHFQQIPNEVNLVQGPMGSCEALFSLAEKTGRKIIKVFDSPNSHPITQKKIWQDECDRYAKGYRIPIPDSFFEKLHREIQSADLILCPSLFVKETMVSHGVPEDKCFILPFGVDTAIFRPRECVPDTPKFICVGSICLRKGHHYLFQAWNQVKKRLPPNSELICVGGVRPDFHLEWKRWKGTFSYYHVLDHNKIANLLPRCTAFVFPSLEEGFARVITEAMASSLPIIATHESGATTVVQHEQHGIIVPSRDVPSLVDAMERLAKDRETNNRMGKAAYDAGAKANSWRDYALRLLKKYSAIINENTYPDSR